MAASGGFWSLRNLAIVSLRVPNALPVAMVIGVGLWGRPKAILRNAAVAAIVLLPLIGLAFTLDRRWRADYLTTLSYERLYCPVGIVQIYFLNREPSLSPGSTPASGRCWFGETVEVHLTLIGPPREWRRRF